MCMRDCSIVQQADYLAVAHAPVLPSHQAHAHAHFLPHEMTSHRFSASSLIHADSMQSLTWSSRPDSQPVSRLSGWKMLRARMRPRCCGTLMGGWRALWKALQRSGRWRQVLDAGGSSQEQLGRPSPAMQVRQWLC